MAGPVELGPTSSLRNNLTSQRAQQPHLPLLQHKTPHPTFTDSYGASYDPWPNGWGHSLTEDTTGIVRLFTKNFNSITPSKDKTCNPKFTNGIGQLHKFGAGFLLGQEPCIDFKQHGQQQELKYAYMKKFKSSRTTTACSAIPAATGTYLPGGALVTTFGKWAGRILSSGSDPLGRWAWQRLMGKDDKIVHIISAYRVSQNSADIDKTTAYSQQYQMLMDLDHTNPNPKEQFITDLRTHIQTSAKNEMLIIGLDANEDVLPEDSPAKETSITALMRDLNLIDVFEHQHGTTGDTSRKNAKKIDHVLVSENVLPAIQHSGFLPWNAIMESDHRTGFVDFDALTLFGNSDDLTHTATRKLTTDYPEAMEEYLTHLQKGFADRNVLSALSRIVLLAKKMGGLQS